MIKFGFIGAGNMGGALAKAVCESVSGEFVAVSDKSTEKAKSLALDLNCNYTSCETVAKESKFIFLGVKPQILPELANEVSSILNKRTDTFVLVTMAAGVNIKSIEKMFKTNCPIIRIMPNTPVFVNKGMILFTKNSKVTLEEIDEFKNALTKSGVLDEIEEEKIDIGSCISGCGPAFCYMFIEALAKGGEKFGLSADKSLKYAVQTVLGSAEMIKQTNEDPKILTKNVCSPGGSTIEGVKVLQQNDIYSFIENVIEASFNRTKELGSNK